MKSMDKIVRDGNYEKGEKMKDVVGKTIKSIMRWQRPYDYEQSGDILTITFTDDSLLEIESFNYEGYSGEIQPAAPIPGGDSQLL